MENNEMMALGLIKSGMNPCEAAFIGIVDTINLTERS